MGHSSVQDRRKATCVFRLQLDESCEKNKDPEIKQRCAERMVKRCSYSRKLSSSESSQGFSANCIELGSAVGLIRLQCFSTNGRASSCLSKRPSIFWQVWCRSFGPLGRQSKKTFQKQECPNQLASSTGGKCSGTHAKLISRAVFVSTKSVQATLATLAHTAPSSIHQIGTQQT